MQYLFLFISAVPPKIWLNEESRQSERMNYLRFNYLYYWPNERNHQCRLKYSNARLGVNPSSLIYVILLTYLVTISNPLCSIIRDYLVCKLIYNLQMFNNIVSIIVFIDELSNYHLTQNLIIITDYHIYIFVLLRCAVCLL